MRIKFENNNLLEMSNILKRETGLPYNIWIDNSANARNVSHHLPRLKIKIDGEYIPVSISREPEVLAKGKSNSDIPGFRILKKWINLNYDDLIKYWNKEIDIDELTSMLKKI